MTPTQAEAARRIQEALKLLESAQIMLDMAASQIFSVQGTRYECDKLGELYGAAKTTWKVLETKLADGRFDLDPLSARSFTEKKPGWFTRDLLAAKQGRRA